MPSDGEDVKEQLEALKRSYILELPGRIRGLTDAWAGLGGAWDRDRFVDFHRKVHALAGSGGMFGFHALSDAARALDLLLKGLDPGAPPGGETAARIAAGLEAIRNATH
jgi:chemotaxis protein histidine kinase CheA